MRVTVARVRYERKGNYGNYEGANSFVELEVVPEDDDGTLTEADLVEAMKMAYTVVTRAVVRRKSDDRKENGE